VENMIFSSSRESEGSVAVSGDCRERTMKPENAQQRVGFIGAGKMATALARGLCQSGFTTPDRIVASDVSAVARESFAAQTAARAVASNWEVSGASDIVVLAVKPQHFSQMLAELKDHLGPEHLIVSIAAGIGLETMAAALGRDRRLVRVMPNTPCL